MSTLRVNNLTDTSGTAANLGIPGAAKAWVNFDANPSVTIRAAYNVSSITDSGTGVFIINFTNAMTDSNYSLVGTASSYTNDMTGTVLAVDARNEYTNGGSGPDNKTTTQCQITTAGGATGFDPYDVNIVVFGL